MTIDKDELMVQVLRKRFSYFSSEPYGDLMLDADRAAVIAVATIRDTMGVTMTKDEKKVLKCIGGMLLFKVIFYASLKYAAHSARKVTTQMAT